MYKTLTTHDVAYELQKDQNANWTYEEAKLLAEYYESLEEDQGESIELDVVAIRCEWSSYDVNDLINQFCESYDAESYLMYVEGRLWTEEVEELTENLIEYLQERTIVIKCTSSRLVMDY